MPMSAIDIEKLIREKLPDARITIKDLAGDGDHYAAQRMCVLPKYCKMHPGFRINRAGTRRAWRAARHPLRP
jgi:hypothetical protein